MIAAVIVPINRLGDYRKALSSLRAKGASSFHMGKERKNRQSAAVELLASLSYCEFLVAASTLKTHKEARKEALLEVVRALGPGDFRLVLDRTTRDKADQQLLLEERARSRQELEFVHLDRRSDSGLWGADILAWTASRQGHLKGLTPVKDARLST